MRSLALRCSGFLLGIGLVLGPAWMVLAHSSGSRPAHIHDYAAPPHQAEDKRFLIVAFGSSSTRGFGASQEAATYPAQLQKLLDDVAPPGTGFHVVNRGINGENLDAMLGRLDDDILPRRPALVLWQLGSNDALHQVDPASVEAGLRQGIERLRAAGAEVVLIGPQWNPDPGRAARFAVVNRIVQTVGHDTGTAVVNRYGLMQEWILHGAVTTDELIGPDGLHLTDRGYAMMAQSVFETLMTQVPSIHMRLHGHTAGG